MTSLTPEIVTRTLQDTLGQMVPGRSSEAPIHLDQNLLEVVDSFGFAELVLSMETTLGIELPLDRVDLADIVHVENLIAFIGERA